MQKSLKGANRKKTKTNRKVKMRVCRRRRNQRGRFQKDDAHAATIFFARLLKMRFNEGGFFAGPIFLA
jgi:hypothetical protein